MQDKNRFKVLVCNLIISVLCLCSIAAYFIWPFLQVDVKLTITPTLLETVLQSGESNPEADPNAPTATESGTPSDPSTEESGSLGDLLASIDTEKFCAELDPIALKIELTTVDVLSSLDTSADTVAAVRAIIDKNVDKIVNDMEAPLNKLAQSAVKEVSKVTVKDSVKQSIRDSLDSSLSDAEKDEKTDQLMMDIGLTDEYLDEKIDDLFADLSEEPIPVDTATDKIVDTVADVMADVKNNADKNGVDELQNFSGTMTNEEREELKKELSSVVETFADENGNVDMNSLVPQLLLMMMKGENGSGREGEGVPNAGVSVKVTALGSTTSSSVPTTNNEETQSATEELKEELRTMIHELIPDDVALTIATVMQGLSYLVFFTFFTWAYLLLKILVKWTRRCNGIKLKLPIWLGTLPYLIFALLPNGIMAALRNPATLAQFAAMDFDLSAASGILAAFDVSFFNGGFLSFYIAIFLLLFGLFYYGPLRRMLKKEAKQEKKSTKPAKKERKRRVAAPVAPVETEEELDDEYFVDDSDAYDDGIDE